MIYVYVAYYILNSKKNILRDIRDKRQSLTILQPKFFHCK